MMKIFATAVIVAILLAASASTILNKSSSPQTASPTPIPIIQIDEKINITATFTIITGSITRSFKAEKYHNLSPDVYIEASDPTVVRVSKKGITWDDFFKTLPMKLSADCLITGDGEEFCNGQQGSLKFYLNNIETPNLLEKEIKHGDIVLIKFLPN